MKKILSIAIFLSVATAASAQFFQGWGIMAGGTLGRQKWFYSDPASKYRSKYLLRYNAEIFAEFGYHPNLRWVTELQYNVKGAKVKEGEVTTKYQNQYAAWNNYLMFRQELYSIIPYVKVGPRAEYVFSSDQSFRKFHVTGAAGAGVEFVAFGPVKFITEAWWVPDLSKSFTSDPLYIKQHCWELRVGIKFGKRGDATCPAYKDQPND